MHPRPNSNHERFSVAHALQLKLRLQNLDLAIADDHQKVDLKKVEDASRSRPFHETVSPYVRGSEDFYLLVKGISRPDLIPEVYFEAYRAVLERRPYLNAYKISDFNKGIDPTFSEIRSLLPSIDAICETDLDGAFRKLELDVKPFPFFQLPAELRLHVYNHLFPRDSLLALLEQPQGSGRAQRIHLNIMRANRGLHDEVEKHLYENCTLFMEIARDKASQNLSNEYISRNLLVLQSMTPSMRQLFRKCEIRIGYLSSQKLPRGRRIGDVPVMDPMRRIFQLLPNLQTLVVSFAAQTSLTLSIGTHRIILERRETVQWLLESIPESVDVIWDLADADAFPMRFQTDREPLRQLVQQRGSIVMGSSNANRRMHARQG
ncbi:hypothetical protein ACN47E_004567 [Coniothyrium glycines]